MCHSLQQGPFGIADNVGMTHVPNMRATCMSDGTLLTPTRPLMAIDASYAREEQVAVQDHFHNGNVWNRCVLCSDCVTLCCCV